MIETKKNQELDQQVCLIIMLVVNAYHSGFLYNSNAFAPAGIINETEIMRTLIGSEGSGCISHDNSPAEAFVLRAKSCTMRALYPGGPSYTTHNSFNYCFV